MIGFQGHVAQDVPPYMTVDGNPLAVRAVNITGLRRRGYSNERIGTIRQLHKLLYRDSLTLEQAVDAMGVLRAQPDMAGGESDADIGVMLDFIASATRGLVR
jgi:UDP-N-acetylglucosamine acyltransferase